MCILGQGGGRGAGGGGQGYSIELSKCVYLASMGVKIEHNSWRSKSRFFQNVYVCRNIGHNQGQNCEKLCFSPSKHNDIHEKLNKIDFCYKCCRICHLWRHIPYSNCFSKTFHWILVFQINDPSVKDIVTFYTIWHRINKAKKKVYVCFSFPDPTYVFGPTLNILLC